MLCSPVAAEAVALLQLAKTTVYAWQRQPRRQRYGNGVVWRKVGSVGGVDREFGPRVWLKPSDDQSGVEGHGIGMSRHKLSYGVIHKVGRSHSGLATLAALATLGPPHCYCHHRDRSRRWQGADATPIAALVLPDLPDLPQTSHLDRHTVTATAETDRWHKRWHGGNATRIATKGSSRNSGHDRERRWQH